jgi:outer membrane lipoprotein-sorting protein
MRRYNHFRVFIFSLVFSHFLNAGEAEKLVSQAEKAVQNAKTLEIVFRENFYWKLTGEENVLKGKLIMSGDDRFRIETDDQVLVSNGINLWTYSKPSNRVLIDKLSKTQEALLPRELLMKYTKGYAAVQLAPEELEGQKYHVLQFTDPEQKSFYVKWKVWLHPDTYLPKKLLQEDLNGNQNVYYLESIRTGVSVNPLVFEFNIPEGAEVIEM